MIGRTVPRTTTLFVSPTGGLLSTCAGCTRILLVWRSDR